MAGYYFDSSAVVKSYVAEQGTVWVRILLSPASQNDIHVLDLAEVEVGSAISRRRRAGTISPSDATIVLAAIQHDFASEYLVLDISRQLVRAAVSLVGRHGLRAYDGLHLAATLAVHNARIAARLSPLSLVSADAELNAAAAAEGIHVEDPNDHP